jgi:hypothetical protein
MKKGVSKLRGTILAAIFSIAYFVCANGQSFKLTGVSDMNRVFDDGYKLPLMYDSINIFGIRGEIISGQFTISAKKDIGNVSVEIGDLKNSVTGDNLPATSVEWNFVGSIPLTKNTPNQPASHLVRPAPAKFPEYLMEERQLDVKAKSWQSVWLTINIPGKAAPGIYTGKVTVRSGQEAQSLPLTVNVYPLTIPEKRHLDIAVWYNTGSFGKIYGIKEPYSPEWFALLKKIAQNFASHRQNSFRVPMEAIGITLVDSAKYDFDFTRFDQIARIFWDTGKMDWLETGEIGNFGKERWDSKTVYLDDYKVKKQGSGETITVPGRDILPYFLPAIENHLRAKGWLNKTIFSIKDEPSIHNSVSFKEVSSFVHNYAPDLIRFNALESTQVIDELEIAIPKLDHLAAWYDTYKNWQQKGHILWFYSVGIFQGSLYPNKTIDVPLIDSRIMHWLNYKYDATGFLHWGWNQWTADPFKEVGQHIGDGWHVYPSKDGFLNSLRWEEMRNGLQDYEYLWMLENKTQTLKNSLGSRFSWIDPKQRGKEIAGQVVQSFSDRTYDPVVLNKAKSILINELIESDKSPSVYVQTNPPEGTLMTSGTAVEVLVWAEPGTKITINRKLISESSESLYLEQFGLTARSNKISVVAEKDGKTKTIVREFNIK